MEKVFKFADKFEGSYFNPYKNQTIGLSGIINVSINKDEENENSMNFIKTLIDNFDHCIVLPDDHPIAENIKKFSERFILTNHEVEDSSIYLDILLDKLPDTIKSNLIELEIIDNNIRFIYKIKK